MLPECFQLRDPILNGGELLLNELEKPRAERRAPPGVQRARQDPQPLKWQSQRARPADESSDSAGSRREETTEYVEGWKGGDEE